MGGEEMEKGVNTRRPAEGPGSTRNYFAMGRRAVTLWIVAAFVFGALAGSGMTRATGGLGASGEGTRAVSAMGTIGGPQSARDGIQNAPQADVRANTGGANVLVVHTLCLGPIQATCSELNELTSKLLAADAVASVTTWDFLNNPGTPTVPDLAFMQQFDVVVVATNWAYPGYPAFDLARTQLGDNLADYVDSGRGGVLTMTCVYCLTGGSDLFTIRGRYMLEDYGPYERGQQELGSVVTGIVKLIPSDPLLDGVGTDVVDAGSHASLQVTIGGGGWNTAGRNGVELAQWEPDHTSAVGKKVLNNGVCTVHLEGYWGVSGADAERLISNLVSCTDTLYAPPTVTIHQPASGSVFAVGTPVTFVGEFTDASAGGMFTAEWSFGTIKVSGTVTQSDGSWTVTDMYPFVDAGLYPVSLTVTNIYGASGTASTVDGLDAFVVIFDPEGGFAVGKGWIMSPQGAYVYDPSATGKAAFDFVARYHKGSQVPEGGIHFRFKAGDFAFASSSYQWLVCEGARCQFKGAGTAMVGHGPASNQIGVEFLVTVVDGKLAGGGGSDGFRIKIWSQDDGSFVVYDNLRGQPDSARPPAIGGGNIRVHQG